MAVSDRPSTKVERASARLIRSPLAQTVRRRDFRDPAPDCSACGSFDDVRHGLGFGDVDGVAASFLTDRSASSLRHHPLGRRRANRPIPVSQNVRLPATLSAWSHADAAIVAITL